MARCSICHTLIQEADARADCPECQQEYHQSCWTELGGCGTYGCKKAAVAEKPPPPVLVGSGWGDTKECPSCGQNIGSSLLVCRCSATFPYADPMTRAEYVVWCQKEQSIKSSKTTLLMMFIVSLFGITAPVTGPIAGFYAWYSREKLAGQNGTYLAIGYGSAGLGVVYGVILALLAVGK
jgi:hypothetical protein